MSGYEYTSNEYSPANSYYHTNYYVQQEYTNNDNSLSSYPSTPSSYGSPQISYYSPTEFNSPISKYQDYSSNYASFQEEALTQIEIKPKIEQVESTVPAKKINNKRPRVVKLDLKCTSIGFGVPQKVSKSQGNQVSDVDGHLKCNMCSRTFKSSAKLFMHQHKYHKNGSSLQCPICLKNFNSQANALVHVRAHTQEKTYKCHICLVGFCDSSTLKKHVRTHTGEKPYECHLCPKKFTQSGNLKRHLTVHDKYDVIQAKNLSNQDSTITSDNYSSTNYYQSKNAEKVSEQKVSNNQSTFNYYPNEWQLIQNLDNYSYSTENQHSYSYNNQYYQVNSY